MTSFSSDSPSDASPADVSSGKRAYSAPASAGPVEAKPKPQDARSEILQHAKTLFRQKGFSAVSMNDLVASAGLTKPTIYYHFTDKETLFTEVVIEMMRHGSELFTAGLKRCKDTDEKLQRLAEGYFRFSPTSLSTMVRDASEQLSAAHLKRVMDAHRFYLLNPLEAVFQEGIESGRIHASQSPEALAIYFISWIDALTTLKSAYGERHFDFKAHAKNLVHIFLHGLSHPMELEPNAEPDATKEVAS